jgi:hypothetical protein
MPDTSNFMIGLTSGSMVNLNALATPIDDPKSTFQPYADKVKLVSGLYRGIGFPTATWLWDITTRPMRDMLRAFCPGQSAWVYIRTRTMDTADSYANYLAVMVWPIQDEARDAERRTTLTIKFENMIQQ